MVALRTVTSGGDGVATEVLLVPMAKLRGSVDPTVYRLKASGRLPARPDRPFLPVDEVRGVVLDADADADTDPVESIGAGARLLFVVAGWLELVTADAHPARLDRGSVLLLHDSAALEGNVRHDAGTRLLVFRSTDQWPHHGEPLASDASGPDRTAEVKVRAMRQAEDGTSYFTALPDLFEQSRGASENARAVRGVYFAEAEDRTFIDMHPEVNTALVMVLSGELELEVSGSGATEVFHAGDVVLAADPDGEGHIDRFCGTTTLLAATMTERDPWPSA